MKTIEIKGKVYTKASDVANELGYTSDYIGQLCRGGKVDAELVGRTWYVDTTSIAEHKSTRYRSSVAKTSQGVQSSLKELQNHPTVSLRVHSYESDTSSLLPPIAHKKRHAPEDVARHEPVPSPVTTSVVEAVKVQIESNHSVSTFVQERENPATFIGKIAVASYDSEVEEQPLMPLESAVPLVKHEIPAIHAQTTEQFIPVTSKKTRTAREHRSVLYTVSVTTSTLVFTALICFVVFSIEATTTVVSGDVSKELSFNFSKTANVIFSVLK